MRAAAASTTTMTTPTRRTMRQQTLTSAMGVTLSPSASSTAPVSAPAAVGAMTSPSPTTTTVGDAKRTTRAQASPSKPPAATATSASATTAASAPTPSPTRARRTRKARSPALPVVRTPQLRPRRTPSSSHVGLRDPYEQFSVDVLREECVRRGLSVRPREQESGVNKPVTRAKTQLVELLQEADMLAMFERQSQKKTGRRSARAVKLTPPPTPIRIAPKAARNVAASTPTPAAPAPLVKLAPTPVPYTTATGSSAIAAAATASNAPIKAPAAKKPTRPPRKVGNAVAAVPTPAATTESQLTRSSPQAMPSYSNSPAAPWLAVVPATQPQAPQEFASQEEELKPAAPPGSTVPAILLHNTVDLTQGVAFAAPNMQETMPEVTAVAGLENKTPMGSSPEAHAAPVASRTQASSTSTLHTPAFPRPPAAAETTTGASGKAVTVRARRGCRFRLINVVLSPDFNTRWGEMNVPVKSRADVNAFWRDVHISFLCQNSFYDKVHFEDALFDNVTPNVIQNHTAQKLQQMWTEIVSTYRRAHNASIKSTEQKPFLDFCAGRLDVLYLQMALLLEPELHQLVLNETPRLKIVAQKNTNDATGRPTSGKPTKPVTLEPRTLPAAAEDPQLAVASTSANTERGPRFVELQNPEMLPEWLLEDQAKTAAERGVLVDYEVPRAQALPVTHDAAAVQSSVTAKKTQASKAKKGAIAPTQSPATASAGDHASPVQTRDMVLHSSAINSIDDSASSDYETTEADIPVVQPTPTRASGKRRREDPPNERPSSDLVELASSRELVAHPHKRMHTAVTTTMTRSQEMVLPPDEFDIQTNRLRKINESIDQCYRTLSNQDAILNDMHREDVESDLRFYLGIKKRIQEQIVMFMHGF